MRDRERLTIGLGTGPGTRRAASVGLLLALAGGWAPNVSAKDRLHRRFDHRNGLEISHVTAIGQDGEGFLWVAVIGQLLRFDGNEFRRWSEGALEYSFLKWHPELGMLVKSNPDGALWRVGRDGLERVDFAEHPIAAPIRWLDVGPDGTLWLLEDEPARLHRRDASGSWSVFEPVDFDGEDPRQVFGSRSGGAHVGTREGLWRLAHDGAAVRVLDGAGTKIVAEHPSGTVYVTVRGRTQLRESSRLVEIRDGVVRLVHEWSSRPVDIVVRGDDVWFTGLETFRYRPGEPVERLDPGSDATVPFPDLFVDREGSLWVGGYDGLVQFPAPETVVLTEDDGTPRIPANGDFARTGEGLWVPYYDGLARIEERPAGAPRVAEVEGGLFAWDLCADASGRLWTFRAPAPSDRSERAGAGILERSNGRFRFHPVGDDPFAAGPCTRSADGSVRFLVGNVLFRAGGDTKVPRRAGYGPEFGPEPDLFVSAFLEESGRLWAASGARLCSIPAAAPAPLAADWQCEDVPELGWVYDLRRMPSGALWAAARHGLFRRGAGGWEPLPGTPRGIYHEIVESPTGGVWITSAGAAVRVAERPETAAGLEVLERLTMWQGLPSGRCRNLLEESDGTLWVASPKGPIRVPGEARFGDQPAPTVALVEVLVDGERAPIDGGVALPYSRNRLELRFAALSYRDPRRLSYRVRSDARDAWVETRVPAFRFNRLAPGRYDPQVVASLDGAHWTAEPVRWPFSVRPPWYRTRAAVVLFTLAGALALYAIYRARVAVLLRLERQRTRIALDLHDEMGAGLGSIGILADLVATHELDAGRRATVAGTIASTAEELGANLRDILWSLRTPAGDLEGLAAHLAERATRLFPGSPERFRTAFPDHWPRVPLSLAVRRNLQLIALEALHNAAKHAGARRVELGFGPAARRWRMWIEDDGRGMSGEAIVSTDAEHGLGLEAMRGRAAQIGATIEWLPGSAGGTRVEVRFLPAAEDRRVRERPA